MARKVMLLTKELQAQFAKVGRQESLGENALVIAKFFHPIGRYTFYATEYDPALREFFGYTINAAQEWGTTSLDELEQTVVRGLHVERDLHFTQVPLVQAVKEDAGIEFSPGAML